MIGERLPVGGMVTRLELDRGEILEARMRTDLVVVAVPGFDHDARLGSASEPLERQALVTELAVEALNRRRSAKGSPGSISAVSMPARTQAASQVGAGTDWQ